MRNELNLPLRQLWALAISGVNTEMESAYHDMLGGWGEGENTRGWCANVLSKYYGADDKDSFDSVVEWLWTKGDSVKLDDALAELPKHSSEDDEEQSFLRQHLSDFKSLGEASKLLAWDMARMITVVGWGYWAGYIDEESAWQRILLGAYRCQRAYDSWETFGRHYQLGHRFWWEGPHEPTTKAVEKLLTDAESPWQALDWNLDLGITLVDPNAGAVRLIKKTQCPVCGGAKTLPSATAYIYCDYCGQLFDFDFRLACEHPESLRPGPAYESILATLKSELETAINNGDQAAYRELQRKIFETYVEVCPASVPPRVKNPGYRQGYIDYMAQAATVSAFDPQAAIVTAEVTRATGGLAFFSTQDGQTRVVPERFRDLTQAVLAQEAYIAELHSRQGIFDMHPDSAPAALQRRIGLSMYAQGWLPYLDAQAAEWLLDTTQLQGQYIEAKETSASEAGCASCGAKLKLLEGAKRVLCESCGFLVEAGGVTVQCSGCGARLAPVEGSVRFSCPYCKAALQSITALTVG